MTEAHTQCYAEVDSLNSSLTQCGTSTQERTVDINMSSSLNQGEPTDRYRASESLLPG